MSDTSQTLLNTVGKIVSLYRQADVTSLPEQVKSTRIEPVVVLEDKLRQAPYVTDILQSVTTLFSAYYLQAVAIMVNVGNVETKRLLDGLQTHRSRSDALLNNRFHKISTEALSLPNYRKMLDNPELTIGNEARDNKSGASASFGRIAGSSLNDAANLSVGKVLEVTISAGPNHRSVIPVTVRLNTKTTNGNDLTHILSVGTKDTSAKARKHGWLSGELDAIGDILFANDLIEMHREAAIKDTTGVYAAIMERDTDNRFAQVVTGDISVNGASGIFIITKDTAKQLERKTGTKLSNFRKRENLLRTISGMLLIVVDTEMDEVEIYTRSIDDSVELTARELKNSNKGSGVDVTEVLKAYTLGNSPSL